MIGRTSGDSRESRIDSRYDDAHVLSPRLSSVSAGSHSSISTPSGPSPPPCSAGRAVSEVLGRETGGREGEEGGREEKEEEKEEKGE